MNVTDDMVNRFLTWRLPDDFMPDCGVSFTKVNHPTSWPVGTNLLTASQARQMLEHVLGAEKSEVAALRKDAERYHCLREHWDEWTGITWVAPIGPKLDAAIDTAMGSQA